MERVRKNNAGDVRAKEINASGCLDCNGQLEQ